MDGVKYEYVLTKIGMYGVIYWLCKQQTNTDIHTRKELRQKTFPNTIYDVLLIKHATLYL